MKSKALNFLLILSSLFGYLEWGKDNHAFLFQAEYEVITNLVNNPASAVHPFTLIPLFGQLLLLFTLFQSKPGKLLTFIAIACIGLLMLFMFLIGIVGMNFGILISTLPFIVFSLLAIRHYTREPKQ